MRKSLLATALIGAFFAPAVLADGGTVTLYGIANVPVQFVKSASGNTTTNQVAVGNGPAGFGINSPSRLGFKGTEDLGGGLKAWFQIETGFNLDDTTYTSGPGFANREGWVGLDGSFGKLGLGRGKTPYTNVADALGDSLVDSSLNLAIYKHGQIGTVTSNRFDNAIRYDSPVMSGFSGAVMYGTGDNKTATVEATKNFALSAKYADGPFGVALAYNVQKNLAGGSVSTPISAAPADQTKNTAFLLTGSYKYDAFAFTLGYQNAKVEFADATKKRQGDSWELTGTYAIDALTLKTGFILNQKVKLNGKTKDDTDYTRYFLGASYALSKRTSTYVEYAGDDYNKDLTGANKPDVASLSIGLKHAF
ncbi:porin [Chitinimonas sp.]|uniref:porin n=1 Tax=Chitinimonas sp. TaxID=1934313 RepID=UPI0035AE72FA